MTSPMPFGSGRTRPPQEERWGDALLRPAATLPDETVSGRPDRNGSPGAATDPGAGWVAGAATPECASAGGCVAAIGNGVKVATMCERSMSDSPPKSPTNTSNTITRLSAAETAPGTG